MYNLIICATLLTGTVFAGGELTIFHHPSSLIFKGHDHVKESILKEIYSSALGFSTEQYSNWNGLFIDDPFNLAEGIVTVAIDGITDVGNGKGHHFSLRTDQEEEDIFGALKKRVLERYPEENSHLIRINLADGLQDVYKYEIFQTTKHYNTKKTTHHHLKTSVDEDQEFLKEIEVLNNIIDMIDQLVIKSHNSPDIFWFRISNLHPLIDLYGGNSTQVKEAQHLLNEVIIHLNNAFKKAYEGKVLVSVITSDTSHTRRARNILATNEEIQINNLAKYYSKDYPVIFNIVLWFGVAMVFSVLAVCIAIATMDPGRDSIIYRMTSTRLKKDN